MAARERHQVVNQLLQINRFREILRKPCGQRLLPIEVRLADPAPRTVADRTAGRRHLTVVGAAAAELHHLAVAEADLPAADSAEAEVTLRPRATAQAVEAGVLLTAALVTRTAVTDLIL